jgi:hypothetical protein
MYRSVHLSIVLPQHLKTDRLYRNAVHTYLPTLTFTLINSVEFEIVLLVYFYDDFLILLFINDTPRFLKICRDVLVR